VSELLEIKSLNVRFIGGGRETEVISDLCLSLGRRETLGIVGESGSGKSVTSLAIMGLLPPGTSMVKGQILLDGRDLLQLSKHELESVRGNRIAMIFQEPMTSLNPIHPVGRQIAESVLLHSGATKKEAMARALELLTLCGIPDPQQRMKEYPHQLSGGMRQRVMIAIALACDPELLIADEPTTALDVTIQAQILELMKALKRDRDMSILMITHDLGIVYDFCDRVAVVYTGELVESAPAALLFQEPLHPYTEGLIAALPRLDHPADRLEAIEGTVPAAGDIPGGCHFHPRCKYVMERCRTEHPSLTTRPDGRQVRCFRAEEQS
jgi:oligopeptide/dipeptide ABC transporter ATP-binding protein